MARVKQPQPANRRRFSLRDINLRPLMMRVGGHQSRNFYWLFSVTMFILVFGIVMVLSSSSVDALTSTGNPYSVFLRQLLYAGLGLLGMGVVSMLSFDRIVRWGRIFFLGGIGTQLLVQWTGLGVEVGGNRNWFKLGIIQFQPSEFIKLGLILVLANAFATKESRIDDGVNFLWISWIPVFVSLGVVFMGKDLGTSLIIGFIALGVTYLTGIRLVLMRGLAFVLGVGVFIAMQMSSSRLGRFDAWLNPGSDTANDFAWQAQHGIWALAAGRITGVGLGDSKLKWSWIPEVDNDYIFAIIGEETGMIGAVLTICLFVALVILMRRTYIRSTDAFMRNATAGIMIWIGLQAFVNVSVVVQNLPVLGVPLPLISSGGSSLISALLAVGVLLAFERHINQEEGAGVTPIARARQRQAARQQTSRRQDSASRGVSR